MNLNRFITGRVSASVALGAVCALSVAACGGGIGSQMAQQAASGFADTAIDRQFWRWEYKHFRSQWDLVGNFYGPHNGQ